MELTFNKQDQNVKLNYENRKEIKYSTPEPPKNVIFCEP